MKKIILVALALSMCLSLSAQLRLGDSQPPKKKSNTHSSTLIIATKTAPRESAGWHGVVDFSCGPHVYSDYPKGTAIAASVSGLYETVSGFTFGVTAGYGHWNQYISHTSSDDSRPYEGLNDFRLMAAAGCIIGRGNSNAFFMIQPGVCMGATEDIAFTGDVKIGYRYMFNPHIGLVASTGITGTWWNVLAVPITIGFVF